jgi:protein-disulfide isomerase-like protein with CxxC motif
MQDRQTDIDSIPPETYTHQSGTSFKDKVIYSLLAATGLAGLLYFGKKGIDKIISNQAQAKSFEDGTPETIAKQIKMAFENDGYPGTNVKMLRKIMADIKNKTELSKVFNAYQHEFHSNMYADMSDELQSTEYNEMLMIVEGKPEKAGSAPTQAQYKAWSKRLKAAFDKSYGFLPGTDEDAIKAVFNEVPTQAAFVNVGKAYYADYAENLIEALRGELEVWEFPEYLKIITSKPK